VKRDPRTGGRKKSASSKNFMTFCKIFNNELENRRSWPYFGYYLGIWLEGVRKRYRTLARTAGLRAEI
jgi:hypothetical protein